MKKLLSLGLVLIFLASSLSGCGLFTPKTTQLTHGLVDLWMKPFNMADPEQRDYSKDISGDLAKLLDERSSETAIVLSLEEYEGLESLGMDEYLQGAEIRFETAYDTKTGDGVLDFNGLGLVNGSVAIHEGAVAVDVSQYLGSLIIYNFESALNFSKGVSFNDRMEDFSKAINPDAGTTSETIAEMQDLLYKYADIAATLIDASEITTSSEELSIMGDDTKVEKQSITLNNEDLKAISEAMLEAAIDDQDLLDFVANNYPNFDEYYTEEDFRDEWPDTIQTALDDLDYNFDDMTMDVVLDVYYNYSGFLASVIPGLPFQKKNPVAIQFNYVDDWSTNDMFYKFIEDGRAFDFSVSVDQGYGVTEFYASNILDGKNYIMDGKLTMPDETYILEIDGKTTISNTKEVGQYNMTLTSNDEYSGIDTSYLAIDTKLTEVKKGSSYETESSITVDTVYYDQPMFVRLGLEGTWEFSNEVDVDLPDFNDRDAKVYDDLETLISDISSGYLFPY